MVAPHPDGSWHLRRGKGSTVRARRRGELVLIPLAGFTFAACALNAIVYGLMTPEVWNARFNGANNEKAPAGDTNWLTIGAIALALLIGTTVLMSSIVFSFQRYFEYQIDEARKLSE